MRKKLRSCIESNEGMKPRCLLDMNRIEMIESSGMKPDLHHHLSAHMTACWNLSQQPKVSIPMGESDLTGFRTLTFSAYAQNGRGGSFRILFDNSQDGEGTDGYELSLTVEKDGWNRYTACLPFLPQKGNACGWNQIGSITFVSDCKFPGATICFDNFFLWEEAAPSVATRLPELKRAAVFSLGGTYAIVRGKRITNGVDGAITPVLDPENIWLPASPIVAAFCRGSEADTVACTLTFKYKKKKYVFSGNSAKVSVNGKSCDLGFYPMERKGSLLLPAEFLGNLFNIKQVYTEQSGLLVLSSRKKLFDSEKDASIIRQLIADTTYARADAKELFDRMNRKFTVSGRGRLLATYDRLTELRKNIKTDEAKKELLDRLKKQHSLKKCEDKPEEILAFAMIYRATGNKKYSEKTAELCEKFAGMENWTDGGFASFGKIAFYSSVGYDWCRHGWSEARKAKLERSMLRLGMREALDSYNGKKKIWAEGSAEASMVDAAMIALSIAMSEVYPETAKKLLTLASGHIESCYSGLPCDGGCLGLADWTARATSLALVPEMLEVAFETDCGFSAIPGFRGFSYFPCFVGTKNSQFEKENPEYPAILPCFAKKFGDSKLLAYRKQQLEDGWNVHAFDLLFDTTKAKGAAIKPTDKVYPVAKLAVIRRNDGYAKLGQNGFAVELGNIRFFKGKVESLSADGNLCATNAAKILSNADKKHSAIRLDTVSACARMRTGVLLSDGGKAATVQTEATFTESGTLLFLVTTDAEVTLSENQKSVRLVKDGKTLFCKLCGALGAKWETVPTDTSTLLKVSVSGREKVRLALSCKLAGENAESEPTFAPLSNIGSWI